MCPYSSQDSSPPWPQRHARLQRRARYYDPATQQFLSRDPLVDVTGQPYAYTSDAPLNGTDPLDLCDGELKGSFFGHPVDLRGHVPGTSDSHISCVVSATLKLRDAIVAVNTGLTTLANNDVSNEAYNDVTGLGRTVASLPSWALRSSPYELATNPTVFWQQTSQNVAALPNVLDPSLAGARSGAIQGQQWAQAIQCGYYATVLGDLVFFAGTAYVGGEFGELGGLTQEVFNAIVEVARRPR